VKWRRLGGGTETERVYGEGTNLKWPWDVIYIYDVRAQSHTGIYHALSADGVHLTAEVSFRYRVLFEQAGLLHKVFGPRFVEILVVPEIGGAVRAAVSRFPTEVLHSSRRYEVERVMARAVEVQAGMEEIRGAPMSALVAVHDVQLRAVVLPPEIQAAIERKMVQQQAVMEYAFRIDRERLEAERKRVEATGIRDFQTIVGAGLTDNYLRWRGIDATLHLAQSPNSRLVIIGGRDGLPVILGPTGGLDGSATVVPAAPVPTGVQFDPTPPRLGSPSSLPSIPLGAVSAPQLGEVTPGGGLLAPGQIPIAPLTPGTTAPSRAPLTAPGSNTPRAAPAGAAPLDAPAR
jgi:regulator of protease activity HflC (stomatin/prohibitin superfamily)